MRVAVAGASGTAGSPIRAELERRGHEVRALSRSSESHPVDLLTGEGLDAALEGCAAVVDATNAGPSPRAARALLVDGCARLLRAEASAGVDHHVCLSIVGIERVPTGYYRVKLEQEATVAEAGMPHSIVRATQFHDLIDAAFSSLARIGFLPRVAAPLQPVDPAGVAEGVADVLEATTRPTGATTSIAGPEVQSIAELARTWKRIRGSRAIPLALPMIGRVGSGLRQGGLTDPHPDLRGELTFVDWLEARTAS